MKKNVVLGLLLLSINGFSNAKIKESVFRDYQCEETSLQDLCLDYKENIKNI